MLAGIWKSSVMYLHFWKRKQVTEISLAAKQELILKIEKVWHLLTISFSSSKTKSSQRSPFWGNGNDCQQVVSYLFLTQVLLVWLIFCFYLIIMYLSRCEIHCHFTFAKRTGNPFPNIYFTQLNSWGKKWQWISNLNQKEKRKKKLKLDLFKAQEIGENWIRQTEWWLSDEKSSLQESARWGKLYIM